MESAQLFAILLTTLLAVLVIPAIVWLWSRQQAAAPATQEEEPAQRAVQPQGRRGRRGVNRMQEGMRRRARGAAAAQAGEEQAGREDEDAASASEAESEGEEGPARAAAAPRVDRRAAYAEKQRQKDAERDAKEAAEEEAARREAEERQRRDDEEAEKWRDLITVDEAGVGEVEEEQKQGLLQDFIDYIITRKSSDLEDLAAKFGLKVQEVITRIRTLEDMGRLTGIMDDRGKYIYVSMEEMQAVAGYILRKGRVEIRELAARSNEFIDLQAKAAAGPAPGDADLLPDLGLDLGVDEGGQGSSGGVGGVPVVPERAAVAVS